MGRPRDPLPRRPPELQRRVLPLPCEIRRGRARAPPGPTTLLFSIPGLFPLLPGTGRAAGFARCGALLRGYFPKDPLHPNRPLFRVDDRSLDHADEDRSLSRRLVGFHRVERYTRLKDSLVVLHVLLGQLDGEEVEIALAEELLGRLPERFAV